MLDAPMTGELLRTYVEQRLAPAWKPGDVMVMDNLAAHEAAGIEAAEQMISGGLASATTVSAGGLEFVFSGGTARGSTALSGGAVVALPGSTVSASGPGIVASTGVIYASAGQATSATSVSGVSISGGGTFDPVAVLQGGTTTGVTFLGLAAALVYSGGPTTDTRLSSGGFEILSSGSIETATVVLSDGVNGNLAGTELNTTVPNGGLQVVGRRASRATRSSWPAAPPRSRTAEPSPPQPCRAVEPSSSCRAPSRAERPCRSTALRSWTTRQRPRPRPSSAAARNAFRDLVRFDVHLAHCQRAPR